MKFQAELTCWKYLLNSTQPSAVHFHLSYHASSPQKATPRQSITRSRECPCFVMIQDPNITILLMVSSPYMSNIQSQSHSPLIILRGKKGRTMRQARPYHICFSYLPNHLINFNRQKLTVHGSMTSTNPQFLPLLTRIVSFHFRGQLSTTPLTV